MNFLKLQLLVWLALLLALGCEKRERDGNDKTPSAQESPQARRPSRPPRDETTSSRQEFEEALRAAKELTSPEERATALADLARRWIEDHPAWFDRVLREIPVESEQVPGLVEAYLSTVLARDLNEAIHWTDSLEDPALHAIALERLAAIMPEERLADAATSLLDGNRLAVHGIDTVSEQFLQRWSAQDPATAAAWLARMPAGEAQNAGTQRLAGQLVMTSPDIAAAWLEALPFNTLRPTALDAMAATLANLPDPIRESMLGTPDSTLRTLLQDPLAAHLPPPPEAEAAPEGTPEDPAETDPEATPEADPES